MFQPASVKKVSGDVITETVKTKSDNIRLLDGAARSLLAQIEKDPVNPSLNNQVGLIYAELGDYEAAERHFQKAVFLCRQKIAELEERQKALNKAGETQAASDLVVLSSRINVELSAAHGNLARVFESLGKHERVVTQLDELKRDIAFNADLSRQKRGAGIASARNPDSVDIPRLSPETMRNLAKAQALVQARRINDAITEYKRVIDIEPGVAVAHQQLGILSGVTGNLYMAEQELKEACRLDPNDSATRTNLGITYMNMGEHAKARREFEMAFEHDSANIEAAVNLSTMLSVSKEYEPAQTTLEKVLRHHPRNPLLLNNLATIYSLEGKYGQAIDGFQKALAISPQMASAHYGLGLAFYNSRQFPQSIREFKRALELNPNLIDCHNKIESAYRRIGLAHSSRSS